MGGTFKYANTLYLGKSDLLPRKLVEIYERPPADNGRHVPPSIGTTVFHGVNANANLPASLFIAEPPDDAKPY